MESTVKKPSKERSDLLEESDDATVPAPMSKMPKHPQCKDILGHKYFSALPASEGGDSPQALAFAEGDGRGHTCFVRAQMLTRSGGFLFTSFRDNAAFAAHVTSRYLSGGFLHEAFYELIRDYEPDRTRTRNRVYIDAEWYAPLDKFKSAAERDAAAEDRLVHILDQLTDILRDRFGCTVMPRFAITEGGREKDGVYKHSLHIIVTNVYTETNQDDRVVDVLSATLMADGTHDNGRGEHVIDSSVYSRNRHFRIVRSPKEKGARPLVPYVFLDHAKGAQFPLAFPMRNDREWVDGGFAYEMENTLVSWPAATVAALGDAVFQLTGFVQSAKPKGRKRSEKPMREGTYQLLNEAGGKETRGAWYGEEALDPETRNRPAQIKIVAPEDLMDMAKALSVFLARDPHCLSMGWRRTAKLEYADEKEDFEDVTFSLIFAGEKGHMCPKGVMHRGNSNHRIMLTVEIATGNIFTKCFKSSTATGKCLIDSLLGKLNMARILPKEAREKAASKKKGDRGKGAVTWM